MAKYKCNICGKEHEEWPSLAYISPINYDTLTEDEKKSIAKLSSDFCTIEHAEQIDRFIRCTMTQKIIGSCEPLEYGLWVSLSEKSYLDYFENFDNQEHEVKYFGWLSNHLPDYVFNESIPTTVFTRKGNQRPEIVPHEDFNHPFVFDYYNGISLAVAEKRIKAMLSKESR